MRESTGDGLLESVRALTTDDASIYWQLRLEALQVEPLAFGKSVEEHRAITPEQIAEQLNGTASLATTFGAFLGQQLVGIASLLRERNAKERHKAHLVGVYMSRAARGRGLGEQLLRAVLDAARADLQLEQVLLGVRQGSPARRLYARLGFRGWGIEPRALKVDGAYVDEEHMVLALRE